MDYDAELKKYRTTAEEILKELKEQPKLTYEQFEGLLRAYTMARFLLPADTDEDEIDKLARKRETNHRDVNLSDSC